MNVKHGFSRITLVASLVAIGVIVAACASRGTDFDPMLVDQLKPKVTRLDEAVQLLGSPNNIIRQPDGTKVVQWMHVSVTIGSSATKSVIVSFDQKDVMVQVVQQSQGKN